MRCMKCGSNNISFQREQTGTVGGSIHSFHWKGTGRKGCLYWLLIGWWWWIFALMIWVFKAMFHICTLGIFLIFKRNKTNKFVGKTVTANKTINRTVAVCQDCGNSWKA